MRRVSSLAAVLGLFAALGVALVVSAEGDSPAPGTPLTKDEYFNETLHFMDEESKSERLYYDIAINPRPRRKCAPVAHHYLSMLRGMLAEAQQVVPPPEIADVNSRLIAAGQKIVRGVSRLAKRTRSGRVVCESDVGEIVKHEFSSEVYDVYLHSRFEQPLQRLRDLGYTLSGE